MASDGLFDVRTNQQVLYETFKDANEIAQSALEGIAETEKTAREQLVERGLMTVADSKKSFAPQFGDNCTIIYIKIGARIPSFSAQESKNVDNAVALQEKLEKANELYLQFSTLMSEIGPKQTGASLGTQSAASAKQMTTVGSAAKRSSSVERKTSGPVRKTSVKRGDPAKTFRTVEENGIKLNFVRKGSRKKQ